MRRFCLSVSVLLVAIVPSLAPADEWPGFLGVRRDGISPETGLIDTLPADGPKPIWRVPGGVGMSAVAVADACALARLSVKATSSPAGALAIAAW